MFTFKLQSVLDHRKIVEDNIKKELAEIRQRILENEDILESLKEKEFKTMHNLKQEQAQGLSSDGVVAHQAFLRGLAHRITQQRQVIDTIHAQEAEKKELLLEAMKKRQILEKLKEQGMARYHQSLLKEERNFIDEIAVNQFLRSTMNSNGEE